MPDWVALFFRQLAVTPVPRLFFCDMCGYKLVLEDEAARIPRCEHCGGEKWHTEKHKWEPNHNDRRFLKSICIAPDDVPIYREKKTQ